MPGNPVLQQWRRYLRLSVQGLIVLALVMGTGLGWLVRSTRIQREAVAAITTAGGSVKYDWEWNNGNDIPGGKPWAPGWLVDLIGVDYFGHFAAAELLFNRDEAPMASIGNLTRLQLLSVFESSITDADLAHLKRLTNLKVLDVGHTQVTDAGLAHLSGLTSLSGLSLSNTQVTDAGLTHLMGLSKLSALNLSDTQVTDAGLPHLKGLVSLAQLDLDGTRVTDAAKQHLLQAMSRLTTDR